MTHDNEKNGSLKLCFYKLAARRNVRIRLTKRTLRNGRKYACKRQKRADKDGILTITAADNCFFDHAKVAILSVKAAF